MILIEIIIRLLSTFNEMYTFKVILDNSKEKKYGDKEILMSFYIIITVIVLSAYTDLNPNIRMILCFSLTSFFYKRYYKVKTIACMFFILLFWILSISISAFSITSVLYFSNTDTISEVLLRPELKILSTIIGVIIVILLRKIYLSKAVNKSISITDTCWLLIPLITNIIIIVFIFTKTELFDTISFNVREAFIIFVYLALLSNFALIISIRVIIRNNIMYNDMKSLNDRLVKKLEDYSSVKGIDDELIRLNHDIKHHIICLKELNNSSKVRKYIESLEKKFERTNLQFRTGNEILDIILVENKRKCLDKGIQFSTRLDFSACNFIENIDVCTIFSNILDNAYEAASNAVGIKRVNLNGSVINGHFVFKCTNSKSNKILEKNSKIITSKKDKKEHGIGLRSIHKTLEKYNASISIDYDDNTFNINCIIPLIEIQDNELSISQVINIKGA